MPRHDDDIMIRDRQDMRDRDYREPRGRGPDRAMFDRDRNFDRGPDDYRERSRYREDRDRQFGADDHNRGIPMDETRRLIASNKVEGTPVFDRHGDKLGTIHNFMVDKYDGQIVYAVLKHGGGFLGLNERYYPLEWEQLEFDTRLGGYQVGMDEEDLDNFGSFDSDGRYHRRRIRSDRRRDRF